MEHKAAVTVAAFALGAREGVLLAGVRMQKHGEIVAHRFETLVHQLLRRGADHYPVSFLDRQPEQLIAHGTAYQINVHVVVTNPLTQNSCMSVFISKPGMVFRLSVARRPHAWCVRGSPPCA